MLTRKVGQSVIIQTPAGPVTVKVIAVEGTNRVKLALDAPDSISILREELLEGLPR